MQAEQIYSPMQNKKNTITIKLKQIHLSVRFHCQIKAYFKYENQQYLIDDKIKLINGKADIFSEFVFHLKKQSQKPQQQRSGFLEIYLESNSGKLKILSREIKFSQLKLGQNDFQHKFDNCPDKNASIVYSISYEFNPILQAQKNIENMPLTESHYINWSKQHKNQPVINILRENSYAQNNLLSNNRLNNFIQNLQKKTIKNFSKQGKSRSNSKAIESQFIPKNSPNFPKSSLLRVTEGEQKRRISYSTFNETKAKNRENFNNNSQKASEKVTIQQTKIIQLNQELKLKDDKITKSEELISSLNQKLKNLQLDYKKVNYDNLMLKSSIERLEDKINAHKEKYEGMKLIHENQLNRLTTKQLQCRQQVKNLTEKNITVECEKQKLAFDKETLKGQLQKNQKKFNDEIQKLKQIQQEELSKMKRQLFSIQGKISQNYQQKAQLLEQIQVLEERNTSTLLQLKNKSFQQQRLQDEILNLKIEIQRLNSKHLLYEQTLESEKFITNKLTFLKEESSDKESHIHRLQAQILSLKNNIQLLSSDLEKEKSFTSKLTKNIDKLNIEKKKLQSDTEELNLRIQQVESKIKTKQTQLSDLSKKFQVLDHESRISDQNLKEANFVLQNSIKIKNTQISDLQTRINELKQQLTYKSNEINGLNKQIKEKQETIDEVTLTVEKYEQKVANNKQINKHVESNKIHASQFSSSSESKLRDSQGLHSESLSNKNQKSGVEDLPYRIRKFNASLIYRAQQLARALDEVNQQKYSLQKDMNILSESLQKLHVQNFSEYSSLRGTKLTLEEKLSTNQRLMAKMKLIIQEKNKQLQHSNQKLKHAIQKQKQRKFELQNLSKDLQQTRQTLEYKEHKIKKLIQESKSKDLIRSQVQIKLKTKITDVQSEFDNYKTKQIQLNKIKSLELDDLKKNYNKANHNVQRLEQEVITLKQTVSVNKIQIQKVNTLFVDIYKQINNIEKEGTTSSFLFIPLREAVKKVEAQVAPKPASTLTLSGKLDKQRILSYKTPMNKTPQIPQPPILGKSPESKISVNSKPSLQKRDRIKSKDNKDLHKS